MQHYQKMLYDRVQKIETAPYHHCVTLRREKRWSDSRVTYQLIVERAYDVPGISPCEIVCENYPGTARWSAIKAYEAYLKTHPGIEAVKDMDAQHGSGKIPLGTTIVPGGILHNEKSALRFIA